MIDLLLQTRRTKFIVKGEIFTVWLFHKINRNGCSELQVLSSLQITGFLQNIEASLYCVFTRVQTWKDVGIWQTEEPSLERLKKIMPELTLSIKTLFKGKKKECSVNVCPKDERVN